MKFRGFSLAEVLISLGVIGVVASLTMPALNSNIQAQTAGPVLMKTINTLQNANMMLLEQTHSLSLASIRCMRDDGNGGFDSSRYIETRNCVQRFAKGSATTMTPPIGTGDVWPNGQHSAYRLNDGSVITWMYHQDFPGLLLVDTNGAKGPNEVGKDCFILQLYPDGDVLAFGSDAWRARRVNRNDLNWRNHCNNGSSLPEVGDWKGRYTCSGSIIDNEGRVKYKM